MWVCNTITGIWRDVHNARALTQPHRSPASSNPKPHPCLNTDPVIVTITLTMIVVLTLSLAMCRWIKGNKGRETMRPIASRYALTQKLTQCTDIVIRTHGHVHPMRCIYAPAPITAPVRNHSSTQARAKLCLRRMHRNFLLDEEVRCVGLCGGAW